MGRWIPVEKKKTDIQREQRLGECGINNQGLNMKIIDYKDASHVTVQFDDGFINTATYRCFKIGAVDNKNYTRARKPKGIDERLGSVGKNTDGETMTIIEYNNCDDIVVEFDDNFKTRMNTTYGAFVSGIVRNPNRVGKFGQIIGRECPSFKTGEEHGMLKEYQVWNRIINRVYNPRYWDDRKNYKDVDMVDDWLYYPNFYRWIHEQENFEKWNTGSRWAIDKDILSDTHHKIYSPDTCCLVPSYVNILFTQKKVNDLPLGVWIPKGFTKEKYAIEIKENGKKKTLFFDSVETAGERYKEYREKHIREVADEALRNGDITERCYKGMLNYKDPR